MKNVGVQRLAEKESKPMLKKSIAFIVTIILTLSSVTLVFSAADAVDATVKEYIAAPSQYTNSSVYGSTTEM